MLDKKTSFDWPILCKDLDFGIFNEIDSRLTFNKIVGDPNNWEKIRSNDNLFENWILPNALLLFSKKWFDSIKWKSFIKNGIPFSMFSNNDKNNLKNNISIDNSIFGKSMIAKIISKTEYSLKKYLEGKWYHNNEIKNPGGYILESIKNEVINNIGTDLGYKLKQELICPYCLLEKNKVILVRHSNGIYSCPRCSELYKNSNIDNKEKDIRNKFSMFYGTTCICISKKCKGKFIPIDFAICDKNKFDILKSYSIKSICTFKKPSNDILDVIIKCPFCHEKFTIKEALLLKSGHKEKSGFLTGLPSCSIWTKREKETLDAEQEGKVCLKKKLAYNDINISSIEIENKINILIDQLIIKLSKTDKNNISGLLSWYFYIASIRWMLLYSMDAYRYFFKEDVSERKLTIKEEIICPNRDNRKVVNVIRGKEKSIHFAIFSIWINIIEDNILEFNRIDDKIKKLKDFDWFCKPPQFSSGPMSTFCSKVDYNMKISNLTEITGQKKPRMAKVYSLMKSEDDKNYIDEIELLEWNSIKVKNNSVFKPNDIVKVTALMITSHQSHAPFQRITRLRKFVLRDIIDRLKNEEETGEANIFYWKLWKNMVKKAKESIKLEEEVLNWKIKNGIM